MFASTLSLKIDQKLDTIEYWMYVLLYSLFFLVFNLMFVTELKEFLEKPEKEKRIVKEFIFVFASGVSNVFFFTSLYTWHGINGQSGLIKGDFVTSLYFSFVTWTTLGYGDFSLAESIRLIAAFEALLGYIYMALLVGLFLNLLQSSSNKNGQ